jgi:NADH:ubiquinone oxidoreductase subunit C
MPVFDRIAGDDLLERVRAELGDLATDSKLNYEHVAIWCRPENLVEVATRLRDGKGLQLRFFTFLSAIDRSELTVEGEGQPAPQAQAPEEGAVEVPEAGTDVHQPPTGKLEVLVHLYSPDHAIHVDIHVPLGAPVCPSLTGVFRGAHWHERETHEMFGIHFDGHPRLVNLYLPEDFEGHPLLKSFKLPTRIVKDWPGAKDPEEAAAGGR